VELQPFLHLERVGLAVVADAPALGQAGLQLEIGGGADLDQAVVDVLQRVLPGELEAFRRVERDDVVDGVGDDQSVGRRFRPARRGQAQRGERGQRQCNTEIGGCRPEPSDLTGFERACPVGAYPPAGVALPSWRCDDGLSATEA
jgi:hypothetical protein